MPLLLHCTDFHGNSAWFHWLEANAPRYDAVILSGDLIDGLLPDAMRAKQANTIRKFLASFPRPLFVVSGNHDEDLDLNAIAAQAPDFLRVDGHESENWGYRFVCAGWEQTPAWLEEPTPRPVILISHQPPSGSAVSRDEAGDWGSDDVRALADTLPTGSLVLSGHVHTPRHWHARVANSLVLNPGVAGAHSSVPCHVVIDLDRRRTHLVGPSAHKSTVAAF